MDAENTVPSEEYQDPSMFLLYFINPLKGNLGRFTWVIQASAAARAALPVPTSVCGIFVCPNSAWLPVFWIFFNVLADVHDAIAYGICANTVRESALKVDFRGNRKEVPWRTEKSTSHQYCVWQIPKASSS